MMNHPKLKYRMVSIPLEESEKVSFILPSSVAEESERRAKEARLPLGEFVGALVQKDLANEPSIERAKVENNHRHWIEEFQSAREPGSPFRFEVEVDQAHADALEARARASARSLPEYLMSRIELL